MPSLPQLPLVAIYAVAVALVPAYADSLGAARRSELVQLILHDCGSCHGMRLTGGLGPALTPQALRDKTSEAIAATVLYGRPGTAMPGWRPMLSETEATWIALQLKQGIENAR